ncbi:MAG: endolytic transglycosylase MltG [Thermodesulfobacteriota bacterium]
MRKRIEPIVVLGLAVAALAVTHVYTLLYTPASREGSTVVVTVPKGASFRVVANGLKAAGVVRDTRGVTLAAGMKNAYTKIKAGEYELDSSMAPVEVLDRLVSGSTRQYPVTFPEGYNAKEMADTLERAGLAGREEFVGRAGDRALASSLGLDGPTLEGYLFPDTYSLTKGMSVDDIIVAMVTRFKEVYAGELRDTARAKGLTMREVVTLASIIEKEAGTQTEMASISAVFRNRLKKGIPLQSDPTVIYGIKDFDGNLTRAHLRTRAPYNTYTNYGLPPGPIGNPGRSALHAALNPSGEGYLYFVSRNDGTHHFSSSLAEHNRAVDYYQRGKGSRRPNG